MSSNVSNESIDGNFTFDLNYSCSMEQYFILSVMVYPIAVVVILILAYMQKPTLSTTDQCCNFSPFNSCNCRLRSCIFPLNMLDGYDDRLGYACIFGAMTVQLTDVLTQRITLSGAVTFDDIFTLSNQSLRPALQVVILVLNVALITFAFYPLFVCISTKHKFIGAILGIICSSYRLAMGLWTAGTCHRSIGFTLDRYEAVFYNLPSLIFLCILTGKYVQILVTCCRKRRFCLYPTKQKLAEEHHVLHVQRLLGKTPLPWHEDDLSFLSALTSRKFKALFSYKQMPYFRFPTRLVATFTIMVAGLYQIGLMVIFEVWSIIKSLQKLTRSLDVLSQAVGTDIAHLASNYLPLIDKYLQYLINMWIVVTCMSFVMATLYLYHTGICYRKHIYRLYRGDRRIFPKSWVRQTNQTIMTNAVRYAGLQIAYFMWGFVLIQVVLFFLAIIIVFVIFVPMVEYNYFDIVQYLAEIIFVPIIMNMAIYYSQVIMTRFLFLQPKTHATDEGVPLAVNNRHVFYNVSLFFFFWNIFLGIVSAIMRVLKGMLLGIFLIPRIDRSVMMRGYESFDSGFMCYLGVLSVIDAHDHPVVKVFLKLLKDGADERRAFADGDFHSSLRLEESSRAARKARHNWFLAYSLVHNPDLIQYRKTHVKLEDVDDMARHRVVVAVRRKRTGGKTSELYSHITGDEAVLREVS